jgi:hypothetical protein
MIKVDLPQAGPPTGRAVEVGVKGEDFNRLNVIARNILDFFENSAWCVRPDDKLSKR